MVGLLMRRALTAAALAAAGVAGSYFVKRFSERRQARSRREEIDVNRWEGEGGSPPDLESALPHQRIAAR